MDVAVVAFAVAFGRVSRLLLQCPRTGNEWVWRPGSSPSVPTEDSIDILLPPHSHFTAVDKHGYRWIVEPFRDPNGLLMETLIVQAKDLRGLVLSLERLLRIEQDTEEEQLPAGDVASLNRLLQSAGVVAIAARSKSTNTNNHEQLLRMAAQEILGPLSSLSPNPHEPPKRKRNHRRG